LNPIIDNKGEVKGKVKALRQTEIIKDLTIILFPFVSFRICQVIIFSFGLGRIEQFGIEIRRKF
jgi:hypothetical protein